MEKFLKHPHTVLNALEKAPRVGGQLVAARLSISTLNSNFKTASNLQNFLFP